MYGSGEVSDGVEQSVESHLDPCVGELVDVVPGCESDHSLALEVLGHLLDGFGVVEGSEECYCSGNGLVDETESESSEGPVRDEPCALLVSVDVGDGLDDVCGEHRVLSGYESVTELGCSCLGEGVEEFDGLSDGEASDTLPCADGGESISRLGIDEFVVVSYIGGCPVGHGPGECNDCLGSLGCHGQQSAYVDVLLGAEEDIEFRSGDVSVSFDDLCGIHGITSTLRTV